MSERSTTRRRHPRAELFLDATATWWTPKSSARRKTKVTIRNLSLRGAMLHSSEPIPEDATILLRFKTSTFSRASVEATVAASRARPKYTEVRLTFADPSASLERYVSEQLLKRYALDRGPLLGPVPEPQPDQGSPRRSPRLHMGDVLDCACRDGSGARETVRAVILSVSEGGARLLTLKAVEPPMTVAFSFRLGVGFGKVFKVEGAVKWYRRYGEAFEMGVEFTAPIPAVTALVNAESKRLSVPTGRAF